MSDGLPMRERLVPGTELDLPIGDVVVGERHRKRYVDLEELSASVDRVGGQLIQPIVVNVDGVLVAGGRRFYCFRDVRKAETIRARVIDLEHVVIGEAEENFSRKPVLPSEIESIRRAVAALPRPAGGFARERRGQAIGATRDVVARYAGISNRSADKIAAVIAAAERDPGRFGHLVEEMDRRGKVHGAYRKLQRAQDQDRVLGLVPIAGKFRTLVLDPPLEMPWLSEQLQPPYATMPVEQIAALDVGAWAEDGCHLYLWTPGNFMPTAIDFVRRWGFEHKAVLTWVKPSIGFGQYFRNATEHVLFATRGKLATRSQSIPTWFRGAVRDHSEKPESFYQLVRMASFPPYGEAFQRQARADFVSLFRPLAPGAPASALDPLEAAEFERLEAAE